MPAIFFALISYLGWAIGDTITVKVSRKGQKLNNPVKNGVLLPLIAIALFVKAAEWSFYFAISHGQTSIIAPIAGSYPTLFVILAFLIFKDPITRQQIAGIGTTLTGIVLLSIFSV